MLDVETANRKVRVSYNSEFDGYDIETWDYMNKEWMFECRFPCLYNSRGEKVLVHHSIVKKIMQYAELGFDFEFVIG